MIEKRLPFLATVGSVSPFVGLFGTVWGIKHSFESIARQQSTNLAVVAPGIAEALLATAPVQQHPMGTVEQEDGEHHLSARDLIRLSCEKTDRLMADSGLQGPSLPID